MEDWKMKLGKVLGIGAASIGGILVVSALGGWFFLLRAPSPEDQCEHVNDLLKKETGGAKLGDGFMKECPNKMKKGEMEGLLPYAERSKCVMSAQTLDEATKCSKKSATN